MTGFVRSQYANIGATASAAIVAFGLVTVPPDRYDSVIARTEFAAVQLQAVVATEVAAIGNAAPRGAATSRLSAASIASPVSVQASAISPTDALTVLATAALGIIATPLWWLAFPVTLPISFILAAQFAQTNTAVSSIFGAPLFTLLGGLYNFALGPLALAFTSLIPLLYPAPTPTAASGAAARLTPTASARGASKSVTAPASRNNGSRRTSIKSTATPSRGLATEATASSAPVAQTPAGDSAETSDSTTTAKPVKQRTARNAAR